MILYHGTNTILDVLNDDYFGLASEGPQNQLIGIWTSLTPAFPMKIADKVLVLRVDSARVLHIPSDVFKHLSSDLFSSVYNEDDSYVHPSAKWRASGYDVVAATGPSGSIGDIIVLNPAKTTVLEHVPSHDVDRLIELELEHWDDCIMSHRSPFVEALHETAQYKMAM